MEEVDWVVRRLRGHRSVASSQMCAKNLWGWIQKYQTVQVARASATMKVDPDPEGQEIWDEDREEDREKEREKIKWERVVELVKTAFWDSVLA